MNRCSQCIEAYYKGTHLQNFARQITQTPTRKLPYKLSDFIPIIGDITRGIRSDKITGSFLDDILRRNNLTNSSDNEVNKLVNWRRDLEENAHSPFAFKMYHGFFTCLIGVVAGEIIYYKFIRGN